MENKYEDAIAVLSEIILNQRRASKTLQWQIDTMKLRISDLEAKLVEREDSKE